MSNDYSSLIFTFFKSIKEKDYTFINVGKMLSCTIGSVSATFNIDQYDFTIIIRTDKYFVELSYNRVISLSYIVIYSDYGNTEEYISHDQCMYFLTILEDNTHLCLSENGLL